jgi:PRC-barrel domain
MRSARAGRTALSPVVWLEKPNPQLNIPHENPDDYSRNSRCSSAPVCKMQPWNWYLIISLPAVARYLPFTRRWQLMEVPKMAMQETRTVATDETSSLISSDKVEGTAVYDRRGEKLGSIHSVMIDKTSGKVAYAVMSFGGFLGIGDRYHPLPWHVLTYDTGQGGYVVDLDRSKLEGAPTYGASETPDWSDRRWGQQVHDYYGARPYWE